ncbi:MAG: ATP-binding protein [Cytophagales bacterium]|nr:ATP-binding protein [Cytophagales bacterium]
MTFSPDQQIFILVTVFLSIFAVIGIYNLSLYFVIRRRVLLDYCIFVFTLMVYTSLFVFDILGIDVDTGGLSIIAAAFAAFGGLLFSRSFFGIDRQSYPKVNIAYQVLIFLAWIIMIVEGINVLIFSNLGLVEIITSFAAAILALLTIALFIFAAIYLWNKEKSVRIFTYTLIPLILGTAYYVSNWLAISTAGETANPEVSLSANLILFSSITLQMILYSVIIGHSLKNLEKEKLELQKDINSRLHEEVKRQTASLLAANEEIADQKEQLEANSRMKNKLFSLISHDMRGPLNGLVGLVSVLDQNKIPKDQLAQFASQLKTKIKDNVMVLNRLLQWSHAQLEEVKVRKEGFSINELVNKNIALFGDKLTQKQLKVNSDLTGQDVYADREMIDTIIRNLIANGIKFTGEQKSLYISSRTIGEKTELKIRDEGIGMDPNLFNHFSANDELQSKPGTDGERGFGFGLLICRDFIKMNDGTLVCESEIDKGTTFTMTLDSA